MSLRQRSFRRHTRNYLATMAAVDPEILVGRQNDGISKRFGHANQACVGEAHRNVRVLLDQSPNLGALLRRRALLASSKATNRARRRSSAPRLGAPRPPRRWKDSDRTASHVDQGGGNSEAWVTAHSW